MRFKEFKVNMTNYSINDKKFLIDQAIEYGYRWNSSKKTCVNDLENNYYYFDTDGVITYSTGGISYFIEHCYKEISYIDALMFLKNKYPDYIESIFYLKNCIECGEVLTSRNTNSIKDVYCKCCR